ncbi:MAG: hypothetical protein AAF667_09555 [Pseudomonadota bacterium]
MISDNDNSNRAQKGADVDAVLMRAGMFALAWCIGGGAAMMVGLL